MIFEFGDYTLDIDVEKTRAFYDAAPTNDCDCDGCVNYRMAADSFPAEVKEFFEALGADPKKAAELMVWAAEDGGRSLWYGGFYHLCGKILSEKDCKKPAENDLTHIESRAFFRIAGGYSAGFTNDADLLEDGFPAPAVQMETDFHRVPWVRECENPYADHPKSLLKKIFGK